MSDSVRPHTRQPTRLRRPWDSPGKNTGVGCHFLLKCMKVKSESDVNESCPTFSDPMDCSLPGSSTHGIFQTKVLEWGAIALGSIPRQGIKILLHTTTHCCLAEINGKLMLAVVWGPNSPAHSSALFAHPHDMAAVSPRESDPRE